MSNVTISVDDDVLRKARIRAIEQGTSVNAVIRDHLEAYAQVRRDQLGVADDLLRMSKSSRARRGGRSWSRDELHERQ